jgi:cellulose biosynthesis protein BcsQ
LSKTIKILVTSQKGGVGKSTISANLAAYFSYIENKKTCLVDFDHQATSGQWVKKARPLGITCLTVDLPNSRGSGVTQLTAKEFLRKSESASDVLISDLTWTDVLPADFLFDFDLVLVPSSLSRVG